MLGNNMFDFVTASPIIKTTELGKKVNTANTELIILQRINIEIANAQTTAIQGRSGAGKTTLLGILAGLDTPSTGAVTLGGINLQTISENDKAILRAEHIGFVFQNFQLLPTLTALENVMLPLELSGT